MPGQFGPTSLVLPWVLSMSVIRTISITINVDFHDEIQSRTMLWDAFRYTKRSAPVWLDTGTVHIHTTRLEVFRLQLPLLCPWLLLGVCYNELTRPP